MNEPGLSVHGNPLLRALVRWEREGGGLEPDPERRAALVQEEEHILQFLGRR